MLKLSIVILQYNNNTMGISKTDLFNEEQNKIANMLKAMAHPARIAIIEHLLKVNTCICGDIVNVLPLAQPTISQHLKELKQANLIKGSIDGNTICYCVNEESFKILQRYFGLINEELISKNTKCC